jgi:hypothetical protein
MKKTIITIALLALVALVAGPATAGTGKGSRYPGNAWATPNVLQAGDSFTVAGCGYDTDLGNVIVGFTGGAWGSSLGAGGCFTIPGIPALSGDTLPAGTYEVTVSQVVRGRWKVTGETYVTVVS